VKWITRKVLQEKMMARPAIEAARYSASLTDHRTACIGDWAVLPARPF
jgi:hypothetical protein